MIFGEMIREHRLVKGLSMQQLADKVGISKAHICDIEHSKSCNPTRDVLYGLMIALDISANDLLVAE